MSAKHIVLSLTILLSLQPSALCSEKPDSTLRAISITENRTKWGDNHLPEDCPLKLSEEFTGITFTGRYASYTDADTWYLMQASDGFIYSCCTDGNVKDVNFFCPNPGAARISGDSPLDLTVDPIANPNGHSGANGPGGKFNFGRYPCAGLIYNDIWYYGTYLLDSRDWSMNMPHFDWQVLQPFIGFKTSSDFGQTWYDETEPNHPLFENAHERQIDDHNVTFNPFEVLIGAPHTVDFGYNLKYAPTDKKTGRKWAYLVAHGADPYSTMSGNSWISGDNIYLVRILMPEGKDIRKNSAYINNPENWQYLAKDGSYRYWKRNNLREVYDNIKPLVDATGYLGNVGLTWNEGLKKFIMTLSRCSEEQGAFNTLILESDSIDGEYKVVQYLKGFATVSYFMNVPSCFTSQDGKTMWLSYSSNYCKNIGDKKATIGGSLYSLCLTEFTIDSGTERYGKYEAESMALLGSAKKYELPQASNGAEVIEISGPGDGFEFYAKNNGDTLSVSVSNGMQAFAKRISVYVNDNLRGKLSVMPTGSWEEFAVFGIRTEVNCGDKVSFRVDKDDWEYNLNSGSRNSDGTPASDTRYRLVGNFDYIILE